MKDNLKVIRNAAMGLLLEKYSNNGMFFTDAEFEKNKGEILSVGNALFRVNERIHKYLPETIVI